MSAAYVVTPKKRAAALAVEWGEYWDYCPGDRDADRYGRWYRDEHDWRALVKAALGAATREEATGHLAGAAELERRWGDSPSTREVARILGLGLS